MTARRGIGLVLASARRASALVVVFASFAIVAPGLALASSVTGVSATANSMSADATQVVYTVKFTAKTAIPVSTGFVELTAPAGTAFSSQGRNGGGVYQDYQVVDGAQNSDGALSTQVKSGQGNVVDVYTNFAINAGDQVEVDAYVVTNPSSANAAGTLSVSTSSDTTAVSTPFPISVASSVSSVSASENSTSAGASQVLAKVKLTAMTGLAACNPDACDGQEGFVRLTAPLGTVFSADPNALNGEYDVIDGTNHTAAAQVVVGPDGAQSNVVDVYVPFPVKADDQVEIDAYEVANPSTHTGSETLSVSTSSDPIAPAAVAFPITAPSSVAGVSATANTFSAGATRVVYTVKLTAKNPIAPCDPDFCAGLEPGFVQLTAPPGTSLSASASEYTVKVAARSQSGGAYFVSGGHGSAQPNIVDVYVPFAINAGDQIEIDFYGNDNPPSAVSDGTFSVSTSSDPAAPAPVPFVISAPTPVSGFSASTNAPEAGASQVLDAVKFVATNPLCACLPDTFSQLDGFVQLIAPAGTVLSSNGADYDVSDSTQSRSHAPFQVVLAPGSAQSNVVDVYMPFAINAGDHVEIDAYRVANPSSPNASATFSVLTSSDPAPPAPVAFPIGSSSAPTAVSSAVTDATAGATAVGYIVGLTTTNALAYCNPDYCDVVASAGPQPGFVRLTAPAGTVFPSDSSTRYQVADGSHSASQASFTVSPGGVGQNVVDVYVPFAVPAGDAITITIEDVQNPSPFSSALTVATSSDLPAATNTIPVPTAVTATAGNVSASVSWQAPALIPANATITDYIVTPYIGSTAQTPVDTHSTATDTTVNFLTNGTSYTFQVQAVFSSAGTNYFATSAPSNAVTPTQGSGSPPKVALSITRLEFGTVRLAQRSTLQTVELSNQGTETLNVSPTITGAGAADFSIVSDTCVPSVPASGTCAVRLDFKPTAAGDRSATLKFTDNASDSPQTVSLDGSGVNLGTLTGQVVNGSQPGSPPVAGAGRRGLPAGELLEPDRLAAVRGGCHRSRRHVLDGPDARGVAVRRHAADVEPVRRLGVTPDRARRPDRELHADRAGAAPELVDVLERVRRQPWRDPRVRQPPSVLNDLRPGPPAGTGRNGDRLLRDGGRVEHGCQHGRHDRIGQPRAAGRLRRRRQPDRGRRLPRPDQRAQPGRQLRRRRVRGHNRCPGIRTIGRADPVPVPPTSRVVQANVSSPSGTTHGPTTIELDESYAELDGPGTAQDLQAVTAKAKSKPKSKVKAKGKHIKIKSKKHGKVKKQRKRKGNAYYDPSGIVQSSTGIPLAGAQVVLLSSLSASGTFAQVPNGSTVMSPSNRRNPDRTDSLGTFGWDTLPGFYRVTASHSGCTAPSGGAAFETGVYRVPPPVSNIVIKLRCPHLKRSKSHMSLHFSSSRAGIAFVTATVHGRHPTGILTFAAAGLKASIALAGKGGTPFVLPPGTRKGKVS